MKYVFSYIHIHLLIFHGYVTTSDTFQRKKNQEIDILIYWEMVNFIKIDFQASISKRKGILSPHVIICKICDACEFANYYVQWDLKFLIEKLFFSSLDLARKSIWIKFYFLSARQNSQFLAGLPWNLVRIFWHC